MTAPETIWAKQHYGKDFSGYWEDRPIVPNKPENIGTEYRRADLPPTLAQALAVPEVRALVVATREHLAFIEHTPFSLYLMAKLSAALAALEKEQGNG